MTLQQEQWTQRRSAQGAGHGRHAGHRHHVVRAQRQPAEGQERGSVHLSGQTV